MVLTFLELLFPTSFDRIKKEKPAQKGMKPLLISDKVLLEKFLTKFNEELQSNESPTLGISHIVLVRNKESKEKVEKAFDKYKFPVFTIFESKVERKKKLKMKSKRLF